jgi:UPF0716 protein FxsA
MRFPFIRLFLLALPFLEIAGFVIVGRQVGVLATLGLVVAAAIVGAVLMRIQGFGAITRIRGDIDAGRDPGREMANGLMIFLAGVLLLIPGFVTDILGLLLFLPPVRALAWRSLRDRIIVSATSFGGFARPGAAWSSGPTGRRRGQTIDLDADEYSSGPRPDSPWRKIDRE